METDDALANFMKQKYQDNKNENYNSDDSIQTHISPTHQEIAEME